jgi:DNA-binding NarL/FixJ family response regulator
MSSDESVPRQILIASDDSSIVTRYTAALAADYKIVNWTGGKTVTDMLAGEQPALVLIDPRFFPEPLTDTIAGIAVAYQALRIIIIENQTDRPIDQYALFKAGAHGFCKESISEALLSRAVQMVCEGEYWIQRKLIARIINDLAREMTASGNAYSPDENIIIDTLTPRELEVAKMVRLGGNNKMIARELDISERTVKAHLSAIFRKLEIQNRLHLALYFNEKY